MNLPQKSHTVKHIGANLPTMAEFLAINPLPPHLQHLEPELRKTTLPRLFTILSELAAEQDAVASHGHR